MTARFSVGEHGVVGNGVHYKIVRGKKGPDDLILSIATDGWRYAPMSLGLLMADFFKQNEDVLYLPTLGFQGGSMYLDAILKSARDGWRPVADQLNAGRAKRRGKDAA